MTPEEKLEKEFDDMEGLKYEILDAVFLSAFYFHRPVGEAGVGNVLDELEAKDIADKAYSRLKERIKQFITENYIPKERVEEYKEALIWCSGAEDFQYPDGKAREGWEKIVKPLLDN